MHNVGEVEYVNENSGKNGKFDVVSAAVVTDKGTVYMENKNDSIPIDTV